MKEEEIMVFEVHDAYLICTVLTAVISGVQSVRGFFSIMAKMENRTAKDFDVYYIPLQVRIESRFVGPNYYENNKKTTRQNLL